MPVVQELRHPVGAMRQDLDPAVTAHIMNSLAYGLVGMSAVMNPDAIPPSEAGIDEIAEIMDWALTPADGGDSKAGTTVLQQLFLAGRQELGALESTGAGT